MNKIKLTLCFAVLTLVNFSAHAQLLDIKLGSDVLVENAIKDAIVVVESNYCIQDIETNQKYGRNDKPYFNVLQFLGCKTEGGIVVGGNVVKPWSVDALFDKYRKGSRYRPLLDNALLVRTLAKDRSDTTSIASNLSFNSDSTLVFAHGKNAVDGLALSVDDKDAVNWIVWVEKSPSDDSKTTSGLEYRIFKKTVDFSTGDVIINSPNPLSSYLGGLYVSAKVISVGLVEFSLSGFVVGDSGEWLVKPVNNVMFSSVKDSSESEVNTPISNTPDDSLTPVGKNDKGKKKKSKASKKK